MRAPVFFSQKLWAVWGTSFHARFGADAWSAKFPTSLWLSCLSGGLLLLDSLVLSDLCIGQTYGRIKPLVSARAMDHPVVVSMVWFKTCPGNQWKSWVLHCFYACTIQDDGFPVTVRSSTTKHWRKHRMPATAAWKFWRTGTPWSVSVDQAGNP